MEWTSKTKIVYGPKNIGSPKTKSRFFILIACAALIFFGLGLGTYSALSHKKFTITEVFVDGISILTEDAVLGTVDEYFSRKNFFGIARRQYFFASPTAIEGVLRSSFPRIKDILIVKSFPRAIRITIRERSIWGTVCSFSAGAGSRTGGKNIQGVGSTTLSISIENESCVYIDDGGFAFAPAPFLEGFLTKKIFTDEQDIKVGGSAVPENEIILYENMIRSFKAVGASITAMLFEKDLPRDARAYAGTWYVLIARDADPEKLVEVLKPILETEVRGRLDELQYIDLRFGNKVFYKLREK